MISEALLDQIAKTIKYVKPVPFASATGLIAQVYRQMQAEFLPVPLVALQSPVPPIMAGVWSILRETLLAGSVDRTLKEAVASVVSKTNECPYCVESHAVMLHAAADHDSAEAVFAGDFDHIRDPRLRPAVDWMLAHQTAHGNGVLPVPFSHEDAPEVIGTAVAFHYINRMVNVFLGDTLLPVAPAFKGLTHRLYAATEGKRVVRRLEPGGSLSLVPHATLPDDLSWASGSPAVAGAFAGLVHAVDEAASPVLPVEVRAFVGERIRAWTGEPMGLGRRWVEDAVAPLEEEYRAAARLALLIALASYQVDPGVVEAFRAQYPRDDQLIAAAAWASLAAARRAGEWLAAPFMIMERGK